LCRNQIAGVSRPRAEPSEQSCWTAEQTKSFLASVKGTRLEWLWALLLTRGMRRGELCGLKWEDLDLNPETGVLRIRRTRIIVSGETLVSTPKTKAGRRNVPLDTTLVSILRSHKARQRREKLAAGGAYVDEGYLFADELGRPYRPNWVNLRFEELAKDAGLPRLRVHDMRHTAASLMLANGTPTRVVTELLGHANSTVTLNLYAHVLPGMAEEAGEQLSQMVLG
jgi:integrase